MASLNEISDKDVKLFAFEMPKQYGSAVDTKWDSKTREELGKRVGKALYEVISEEEKKHKKKKIG